MLVLRTIRIKKMSQRALDARDRKGKARPRPEKLPLLGLKLGDNPAPTALMMPFA